MLEAAVVGRADEDGLIKPAAFIVLNDAAQAGDALGAELREHCRAGLDHYKYPRWFNVVDDLPKTATGKIQRFRAARLIAGNGERDARALSFMGFVLLVQVRLCLEEKGIAWTGHRLDLMKFENLRPDYLAMNRNGVVPTIVHDGTVIVESSIINEYLDDEFPDTPLRPDDSRRTRTDAALGAA